MKKIESQKELEKDLLSKVNKGYGDFKSKLFKKDDQVYGRRSFNDLFNYYKVRGITELQLMKALKKLKFIAIYCNTPNKIVFFIGSSRVSNKFWWSDEYKSDYYKHKHNSEYNTCGKYDGKYLEELYDKV